MRTGERIQHAVLTLLDGTRVGNALAVLMNRYESAIPGKPSSSWIPAFNRDARFDANSFSRWEMARKIQYFERNSWLVQRLRDTFVKWVIGPNGLNVVPASSDGDWNQRNQEAYLEWCERPCLDSTLTMAQVHRLEAGTYHLLGECFTNETRLKERGKPSRPAIQLIDPHRCSSPGVEYSSKEEEDLVDGVQLGKDAITGKVTIPTGYWLKTGFDGDEWTLRSTAQVLHIFDPERIGMFRGITPYHAVLTPVHQLFDLEEFEMQRAYANAEDAKVWETWNGEAPTASTLYRAKNGIGLPNGSNNATTSDVEKRLEMYRKVMGARTVYTRPGEKITTPSNPSPSAATQWLWRLKMGQVCEAVGIPLILAFPEIIESAQGTLVRGIYADACQGFKGKFPLFAQAAKRKYRFFTDWARNNDPRCVDAPADWGKCTVEPTKDVDVDVGNNSAAKLAEYAAGTTTLERIAGAMGTTARALVYGKGMDVAMVKKAAKEITELFKADGIEVLPEEIMGNLADIAQKLAIAQGQTQEPDDDEAPVEKEPVNA